MSLIQCAGNASEAACKTPSFARRVGLLCGSPIHLLTSVLGLQVPHVGGSEAWGRLKNLQLS